MKKLFASLLFLSALNAQLSTILAQGPLAPPGGPAPTMKTLDQIEPRTPISSLPFTISASGSYYVTGNLTGVANQHGITINADNVTLDLGGFGLVGPGSGTTSGIRTINAHVNTTIRNGTVRGWLGDSVAAESPACTEMHVENLRVFHGGDAGIFLGNSGTAKGCEVRGCAFIGIPGSFSCKIIECLAAGQSGGAAAGIFVGSYSIVTNCVATGNGTQGIQAGASCVITGCTANTNASSGFVIASRSSIAHCTASGNGSNGIMAGANCSIRDCTAGFHASGSGIVVSNNCTIVNCTADSNLGTGITGGDGCAISGCTSNDNGIGVNGIGISTGAGGLVTVVQMWTVTLRAVDSRQLVRGQIFPAELTTPVNGTVDIGVRGST